MSAIEKLPIAHFEQFRRIVAGSYPRMGLEDPGKAERLQGHLELTQSGDPTAAYYGAYRRGQLVGACRIHDFLMTWHGFRIGAGGIGMAAVDLPRRKEHVFREMMLFFLRRCRAESRSIALLYPFRPDYYRKMGYGFGMRLDQYRLKPGHFPRGPGRERVAMLDAAEADRAALRECHERVASRTHGMLALTPMEEYALFENPAHLVAGYREEDGRVAGYLVFSFVPARCENPLRSDVVVQELVAGSPAARIGLLAFLHSLQEQVDRVVIASGDPYFHHLFVDPTSDSGRVFGALVHETGVAGIGLMYRLADVPAFFRQVAAHPFGGVSLRVRLRVRDEFLPENDGPVLLRFSGSGVAVPADGPADVEVRIGIDLLSSLLMGVIPFRRLHEWGLAGISDPERLDQLERIFEAPSLPLCTTAF